MLSCGLLFGLFSVLPAPNFHGAAMGFYGQGIHGAPTYEDTIAHLKSSGASSISFVVPWYIDSINGGSFGRVANQTPSDETLSESIRLAHAQGLTVMLMPILLLRDAKEGEWRGRLALTRPSEFWRDYGNFIERYARFAEKHDVALYSVGSELSSLEQERGHWLELIRRVRGVYSGHLIYSANWDHFYRVSFWGSVDYIGISAYFELTTDRDAKVSDLIWAWEKVRWMLVDWLAERGKPLIFTELGYPSLDGGAVKPWHYAQGTQIDLEEQRRAFYAFREVWANVTELHGVYFWNWWGPRDARNTWYTIPGKPAEREVRHYFQQRARVP